MVNQRTIDTMKELLEGHCWEPMREAAVKWLEAVGTDSEDDAKANLIPLLVDSVATVDEILEMFKSDEIRAQFGDMAEPILSHTKQLKANGEKYCDCPACMKARGILADLGNELK